MKITVNANHNKTTIGIIDQQEDKYTSELGPNLSKYIFDENINFPLNIITSDEESVVIKDYDTFLNEEYQKEQENTKYVLTEIEKMVSTEYFESIKSFLYDEENGIYGDLELVTEIVGDWQDESGDYWDILKGMYVDQSCGYSGDDYHGTLEVKINDKYFLRTFYSL